MEIKDFVAGVIKNGGNTAKAVVKNVNITTFENYVRLGLTLDKSIKGYVAQEDGTYKLDETKVVFISLYSVTAIMKQKDDISFVANHLLANPQAAQVLFSNAKIDLVQQPVKAGESYVNPFSESANEVVFDHDTIINHLVDFSLTDRATALVDKLALSLMGI
jgi:hypothetical protein|nr:MAG TPA: hypothetical protein [Crassvirales sp.]